VGVLSEAKNLGSLECRTTSRTPSLAGVASTLIRATSRGSSNCAKARTIFTPLRVFPLPFTGTTRRGSDVRGRLGLSLLPEVSSSDDPWLTPDHISRFLYAQLSLSLCTLLIWVFLARTFAVYHLWNSGEKDVQFNASVVGQLTKL
jgi:hypothetical protein